MVKISKNVYFTGIGTKSPWYGKTSGRLLMYNSENFPSQKSSISGKRAFPYRLSALQLFSDVKTHLVQTSYGVFS